MKRAGEREDPFPAITIVEEIADELAEAGRSVRRLKEELAGLKDARVMAVDRSQASQTALIAAFNSAAARIEGLTKKLNQTIGTEVAMG